MSYQPIPQKEEGGQSEVWVADEDVKELLRQVVMRLGKIELHLRSITDEEILEGDISC